MSLFAIVMALTWAGAQPEPARAAEPTSYEVFTGSVADFYVVPSPLLAGAPGTLIRVQDVSASADRVTKRIMYHSVDGAGRDRAVTGMLTFPTAPAPPAGRPVVSIANGTAGMAPVCAPSRGSHSLPTFGLDAVTVASDYIGLGPVGELHAYLSRTSEAHSVIDAVRAARNYAGADAGTEFMLLGGSQGGHGALAGSELASSWAPELDLMGTVAMAPAAIFDKTYGRLDEFVIRVVGAMGFLGVSTEHPEIDLTDYVSPAGLASMNVMRTKCMSDVTPAVLSVPFDDYYLVDPLTVEPTRSIMISNDVGFVASQAPVLLVQGTDDVIVNPLRTEDLFARMCATGQVVAYDIVPGADHDTVGAMHAAAIETWLAARLAGEPAPTACAAPPTTTTTMPASTTTVASASTTVAPAEPAPGGVTTSSAPRALPITNAVVQPAAPATPHNAEVKPTSLARTGAESRSGFVVGLAVLILGAAVVGVARRRPATN